MARPPLLVARLHDLRLPKSTIIEATARPHHLNGGPARLARPRDGLGASARMDRKRKSEDVNRKGKLAIPPTQKSPRLAGLLPFAPPVSPRSVLRSNKLLVLAIAAARGEPNPKAQASAQATVEKPSVDVKGKKAARISVKPLRKRFSQRVIARGGPSRPKPKKAVVIDLVSDEEEEAQGKDTTAEEPPLVATQAEEKEEKEDPEE
ncbi:hypothetical protein PIB30_067236 [Stylosanthes scabra]|uniref:Uncharacterized protein n=1 Tax=Stylosanthes scabra TaxID=79078 RepID=A0ABU6XNY4_9FABA|nr:hypothetical protein [Stylosanthes scabra]